MLPIATGYSAAGKSRHWLIAVLVAAQLANRVRDAFGKGLRRCLDGSSICVCRRAILIVFVMAIRFVHRLLDPVPLDTADSPRRER